jgi:Na+/proline symporter
VQTIDWILIALPLLVVFTIALRARRYVKGVADFLAAGRVAGRYVICVSEAEAGMGLISLVGLFEFYYASGFAISFWNQLTVPLGMIILLTGYCIYRFRETRAMTMGQFFEIRYSRTFRIFAAVLQSISGVINYAIFPAVGARFLIYFCDLPLSVEIVGFILPTFGLLMALFLLTAFVIVSAGGQITIMVTDCVQGILSYPLYAIVVIFLLLQYPWFSDMAPALLDRPEGKSMLNPFDTSQLRDFNLFYILVGILGSVLNRMSWSGSQGYRAAALNAHEQKMGAVLGTWRAGFSFMMFILLAASAFTFLHHPNFQESAGAAKAELTAKVMEDVAGGREFQAVRQEAQRFIRTGDISAETRGRLDLSFLEDPAETEPMMNLTRQLIASEDPGKAQTFGAIYGQMRVPMALKHMLPTGILGIFCAICIFLLISTDTTYMHSWGSIIVQDIVVPLRGKALTPAMQLRLLRLSIAGVAAFAWLFSYYFSQVDFILMFFARTLYCGRPVLEPGNHRRGLHRPDHGVHPLRERHHRAEKMGGCSLPLAGLLRKPWDRHPHH